MNVSGERKRLQAYYEHNPLMVSSPFGGVDRINGVFVQEVFERLAIPVAGRRVLDVGCGRGLLHKPLTAMGGVYTGMDFVRPAEGGPSLLGDAQRLPFQDGAFDGVCCVDAFEHLPEMAAAACEFRRVLRAGGWAFLSAPNYGNVAGLVKWACETVGWYEANTWAPFRNWQPQELEHPLTAGNVRRLFRDAGFARQRRVGHAAEAVLGLFPWVEHKRMPEAVKFRLQRLSAALGPALTTAWPGASLHLFWRFDV